MPYRRLPKTDQARIRTLTMALKSNVRDGIFMNVLTFDTYHRVEEFLARFSREVAEYRKCVVEQSSKRGNLKYEAALKRARMYVSHFIQVLSMSIVRGEIARSKRSYYGLPQDEDSVPNLFSESAVLEWGHRAIEGERRRQAEGGVPIYNPTMGRMSVEYEIFKEMYERQRHLGQRTAETLQNIAAMRPEADAIILEVWGQIEKAFSNYPPEERIKKCATFGVIYYTRTDRKKKDVKND
ncbi:MAG: hypothetical protein IJN24_05090 [Bacteroidaceae bacterium]|nr:hypothetical protein [Bacteroidaceae bacterium]